MILHMRGATTAAAENINLSNLRVNEVN